MRLVAHRLFVPILVSALGLGSAAFAVTGAMSDDVPVASEEEVVEPTPAETTQPTDPPPSESPEETEPPVVEEPVPTAAPVEDTTTEPKKERSTEGCPEGFTGNHGQYVSSTTDTPKKDAAHSQCGKPVKSEKPEKTPKPEKSPKPEKTPKPTPSEEPEVSEEPEISEEPGSS